MQPTAIDWDGALAKLTRGDYAVEYERAEILVRRALWTLKQRRPAESASEALQRIASEVAA